ncbi:MAG: hypothetical protein WCS42_15930 [Verrucomicrobiota bacterium]
MKTAISRPTARKYVTATQPPQELKAKHGWGTRKDPLVEIWPQAETLLAEVPELAAKCERPLKPNDVAFARETRGLVRACLGQQG